MTLFVLACILIVVGVASFVAHRFAPPPPPDPLEHGDDTDRASNADKSETAGKAKRPRRRLRPRRPFRAVGATSVALAVVLLFFASWTAIDTKNIGVYTTFGKVSGYSDDGFHWKAPWETPHEINDTIQTDTYASDAYGGPTQRGAVSSCINVRIERQATACVNSSIRWQIRQDGVDYLYRNFKDTAAIQDNLVLRDLQQAMNEAFVGYDPLGIDSNGNSTNEPLSAPGGKASLSADVTALMQKEIGDYIDVSTVNIALINFDSSTQQRINQIQGQVALTEKAKQAELTARAQAEANRELAKSVASNPGVLESKCLDIVQEAITDGKVLPAGFNCFATTTPVTIPAK